MSLLMLNNNCLVVQPCVENMLTHGFIIVFFFYVFCYTVFVNEIFAVHIFSLIYLLTVHIQSCPFSYRFYIILSIHTKWILNGWFLLCFVSYSKRSRADFNRMTF